MIPKERRDLTSITRVLVPRELAEAGNDHLREVGLDGLEGFVLWAGERVGNSEFRVRQMIVPEQHGLRVGDGVCVTVDGAELFRLNVHLYESKLELIAQLHTHPDAAYHSETDDSYPIATQTGALSIVIPDFAEAPFAISGCAIYRLQAGRRWVFIRPRDAERLIHVTDDAAFEVAS
jgi:hypothetical protein